MIGIGNATADGMKRGGVPVRAARSWRGRTRHSAPPMAGCVPYYQHTDNGTGRGGVVLNGVRSERGSAREFERADALLRQVRLLQAATRRRHSGLTIEIVVLLLNQKCIEQLETR